MGKCPAQFTYLNSGGFETKTFITKLRGSSSTVEEKLKTLSYSIYFACGKGGSSQ